MPRTKTNPSKDTTANLGFEAKLWLVAEQALPAPYFAFAEYFGARPEGLLGLIFLKYISDTFEEHRAKLIAGSKAKSGDYAGANPEDPDTAMRASARHSLRRSRIPQDFCAAKDQYKAENVFWVPADV
jgi:type I restriction enzyme M protein